MNSDPTAAPLMRKLLIGQILENPATGPTYDPVRQVWSTRSILKPNSDLCWHLVWLQGYVISIDESQSQFVLDDGTGRLLIRSLVKDSQSHLYQPSPGDLVAVVGKLVQPDSLTNQETVTMTTTEEGAHAWHVIAKSVTQLGKDGLADEVRNQLSGQAVAELSWPLEVVDMTCAL